MGEGEWRGGTSELYVVVNRSQPQTSKEELRERVRERQRGERQGQYEQKNTMNKKKKIPAFFASFSTRNATHRAEPDAKKSLQRRTSQPAMGRGPTPSGGRSDAEFEFRRTTRRKGDGRLRFRFAQRVHSSNHIARF